MGIAVTSAQEKKLCIHQLRIWKETGFKTAGLRQLFGSLDRDEVTGWCERNLEGCFHLRDFKSHLDVFFEDTANTKRLEKLIENCNFSTGRWESIKAEIKLFWFFIKGVFRRRGYSALVQIADFDKSLQRDRP